MSMSKSNAEGAGGGEKDLGWQLIWQLIWQLMQLRLAYQLPYQAIAGTPDGRVADQRGLP